MNKIADLAKGQWFHLLTGLGISAEYLQNRHGPCPICGGKDRFRWDNRRHMGDYFCTQCGSGDGFDLAMKVTGRTFRDIATEFTKLLGPSYIPPKDSQQASKEYNAIKTLWTGAQRPKQEGPVSFYLQRRIGYHWSANALRETHTAYSENKTRIAMLWKICTHTDMAVNIHQTFLTPEGHKDEVQVVKKVMPGKLPDGCAIRTAPPAPIMGVAEGVESALSASIMHDIPVWACVNGNLLSKWVPPEIAEVIYVFADNDENYCGQAKAYTLANRLEVQYKRKVHVVVPYVAGYDMNDLHRFMMQSGMTKESYLKLVQ